MQGTNLEQHSHVWYVVIQGRVDMCVRCVHVMLALVDPCEGIGSAVKCS